ncbi:MAG: ABC transporter ATP-binding protein, partial [Pseudobdellovibrionaceae bacterium]
ESFTPQATEEKPAGKSLRMSFKHKNELEGMEPKILAMEEELQKAQTEANLPEVVSEAARLQELHAKMMMLQTDIEACYVRWAELEKMAKGE